ncbi:acyl-CoA ligase (AMP-forming), exosortase A system-associated [Burkholderia sp. AU31652]|uniref:acyl-CoA ligase (AMP-forming), exosortase A system-associated n=1 Tax=Burkholderia sp. AU31652 TaxID=2015354 RepID=UPI000B7A65BF|nr:acyl-CoA ligase (AMP-forming), exosortase A system-associated [Burkholderia sp. AU31652]OXI79358.1 acyl-CoA ligase (AMP-forming), exosortase A system-associated [Burkholderia sp. AU31652]
MNALISVADLLEHGAARWPQHPAYADGGGAMTYEQLARAVRRAAAALASRGVQPGERVAIYAPKRIETVVAMLAANALGAIFVPVNPQLKEAQIEHIVTDSGAALFMTGAQRLKRLPALAALVGERAMLIEELADAIHAAGTDTPAPLPAGRPVDDDPAALLYTSGSTGKPKGVVVSHRNLVSGAFSVAAYQGLADDDVVLGVLPLSFDAGLSQLTTALAAGACYAPLDFLQPAEVPRHCDAFGVTSITGVPPLWMQLASAGWSDTARTRIRRFANTGGHLATPLLHRLQAVFTNAAPYLMYGLTEAFRSTYLPPADAALRPTSIGKAVPNAEILVLRADGNECAADEPGELVHRGAFVTLGYWNRPELTAQRFRPLPRRHGEIPRADVAVWSGDIVRRDADGYLYFVARGDDMIKTSGYRVSPTEVEDVLFALPHIREAAVFGVPHASLGEAIAACVVSTLDAEACRADIARACRDALPTYMSPLVVEPLPALPRNPNGKIDRPALKNQYRDAFAPTNEETAA